MHIYAAELCGGKEYLYPYMMRMPNMPRFWIQLISFKINGSKLPLGSFEVFLGLLEMTVKSLKTANVISHVLVRCWMFPH